MKRLILQTYVVDNVERDTINTYKRFPKLERLSRQQFKRYAKLHGADYEFFNPEEGQAHWIRMIMFDMPEYDEILYVDCDILIHPSRFKDNIFDYVGNFVPKIWAFPVCNQVPGVEWPNHPSGDFNAGVMKVGKREAEQMKKYINNYYHPTHNQSALNECWKKHIGPWRELPYKFNVTHRPCKDTVFRHYAGLHKICLLYTSPSPRDRTRSRMPSSA